MSGEKTMRCIEECQNVSEQIKEMYSNAIFVLDVFCLNIRVETKNLQQTQTSNSVISEIGKNISKAVVEPLKQKECAIDEYCREVSKISASNISSLKLSANRCLEKANNFAVDINFIRKQIKQSYLSLKIHNAHIGEKMSNRIREMEAIMEAFETLFDMFQDEIRNFEDVLDSITEG